MASIQPQARFQSDALWTAITARIESDGGVMHKDSMLEVFRTFGIL